MRRIWILGLFLLTGLSIWRDRIPEFALDSLEGERLAFSELAGEHLTVIDFWATWCGPCLQSIPALVDLSEAFEERGVNFIGISVDSPRNLNKVKPFARSMGISYPVLLDVNSEVMTLLNVTSMPTLLVVNAGREIVLVHEGYNPGDADYLREEIERLLIETTEEK